MRTKLGNLIRCLTLLTAIVIGSFSTCQVQAFSPAAGKTVGTFLLKESKFFINALPNPRIVELAKVAEKPGGTKIVGEELAQLKLPNEVLEDTFARILVHQGRIPDAEAQGWMKRLSGVDGFRAAMRKSMGASPANTIGHVNEVRIADNAAKANIKVRGIGQARDLVDSMAVFKLDDMLKPQQPRTEASISTHSSERIYPDAAHLRHQPRLAFAAKAA